jgi:hypothetical protein
VVVRSSYTGLCELDRAARRSTPLLAVRIASLLWSRPHCGSPHGGVGSRRRSRHRAGE